MGQRGRFPQPCQNKMRTSVPTFLDSPNPFLLAPGKRCQAQPVDATLSNQCNQLIRQYFPPETDLSGCTQSYLARVLVPFESTLATDFLVFNHLQVDLVLMLRRHIMT